jgi:hypothetical protein
VSHVAASTKQGSKSQKAVHSESEDGEIFAASGDAVTLSVGGKKFVDDDEEEEDEQEEDTRKTAADSKR